MSEGVSARLFGRQRRHASIMPISGALMVILATTGASAALLTPGFQTRRPQTPRISVDAVMIVVVVAVVVDVVENVIGASLRRRTE